MSDRHQFLLDESKLPKTWYNINADLPVPPEPVLHPASMEPVTPDFLSVLLPMSLILQEVSTERYVEIPEPVREIYRLWRPTPLLRAVRLEKMLDTPAHIYYKNEGVSPVGSHKPNTSVPQAFYNKEAGTRAITTETGAGQWGSAMAMACNFFDLDLEVYMVKVSYHQKPYRRIVMENFGAQVYASPTDRTHAGRAALQQDPENPGSLGLAISEAMEVAATSGGSKKYSLGSVLGHVLMHQTVIGEEALIQMGKVGEQPDILVGCTGGGSNFGGLSFPFLREKLAGRMNPTIRCVEPAACPSLTKGIYAYDFGDTAGMTPLVKMHTLGHDFVPEPIHAGGLRYHGMAPLISHIYELGLVEAEAIGQVECFERAVQFARTEGIIPAPEPTHAIAAAAREALKARESGEEKVILTALCGHGHFDLSAYDAFLRGDLVDYDYPEEKVREAMERIPVVAG